MTIKIEEPYAFVVSSSCNHQYCANCLKRSEGHLHRCSACRFAHYCSQDCQREAWQQHKSECTCLIRVHPRVPTDTARLIARIAYRLKANVLQVESGRTFFELVSHVDEIRQDPVRSDHFAQLCAVLGNYLASDVPTAVELLEIFGRVSVNCFSICSGDLNSIGVGLYLNLSALNHSCKPNAVVVFEGRKAILNALTLPVPAQLADVRVSYIELLSPTAQRRRQLAEAYYFTCDCVRCCDPTEDEQMLAFKCSEDGCPGAAVPNGEDKLMCVLCSRVRGDLGEALRVQQYAQWQLDKIGECQKSGDHVLTEQLKFLHTTNVYLVRTKDCAFDACIQLELWEKAVCFGLETLPAYERFYPSNHPSVGVQLLKVGKLQLYLQRLPEAEYLLQKALAVVTVSYGSNHSLYSDARDLLESCREERRLQGPRMIVEDAS